MFKLRHEKAGQTLQATDLVHEAYGKLVGGSDGASDKWNSLGHFFGAAAEAMRRILVDRAREKSAQKRGGDRRRLDFEELQHPAEERPEELLDLDVALSKLEARDPAKAELVKLRFFAGLTTKQAASILEISPATADRNWSFARAWLKTEINSSQAHQVCGNTKNIHHRYSKQHR